jgi:hypothetical protein
MTPLQLTQLDLLLVALSSSTIKDNINISIIKKTVLVKCKLTSLDTTLFIENF